jgi:hypothetical protein
VTAAPFPGLVDLLILVERAVTAIEQGGGEADLRDLKQRLIDVLALIERDPGFEMAGQDLYDAAAAYAAKEADTTLTPRHLRLLREARQRYRSRAMAVRPNDWARREGGLA